ncbi:MAG: bifunctional (p)ppGpp synthetase/guanosine-3',5'-bis(diphosphate) 3'-pyrophosphohydrolase, partial [Candidatus Krumholzibacteria bacterium]|nr:bifunctional (p)ppGpp synthetase/guanosine-3',5'-bis(diphosphate) 3'-pyrophosphohydrolase [Candidatus Krumholzibacteria bacterium]
MKNELDSRELDERFRNILRSMKSSDEDSKDLLHRAYEFASSAHKGQFRLSGEPFITHGLEVARILAVLGLDTPSVAAGLLHDVVEDTCIELEEVEERFGQEIAGLVEGLTELGKLAFRSPEEKQVESARRM